MQRPNRRQYEIILFLVAYAGLYLAVVGPGLGAAFGLDRPMLSGPDTRPYGGELPDTARGWLFVLSAVPVLLGYMYLRARLAGDSMSEFWNPDGEAG